MRFVGIDPGHGGAVSALDCVDGEYPACLCHDTPATKVGTKKRQDPGACAALLAELTNGRESFVLLEHVSAMRRGKVKQGVASAFNFGASFGIWLGVIGSLRLPMDLRRPNVWKKHMGLSGKPKEAAVQLALRLFPDADLGTTKASRGGRAEALLLAEYGRRIHLGGAT